MNSSVEYSAKDEKMIESMFEQIVTNFIKERAIDPTGKTRKQLLHEMGDYVKQLGDSLVFVVDHTEDVLTQARVYKRNGKNSFACLFYAIWLEHTLNNFILYFARRTGFADKEIGEIIRDTSYRAKLSWLPRLFGAKPFSSFQINKIVKLMEVRNSFVHYKWRGQEQADKDLNQVLSDIEKTVKYVRAYENKHVIGVSRRKVKHMLKRT